MKLICLHFVHVFIADFKLRGVCRHVSPTTQHFLITPPSPFVRGRNHLPFIDPGDSYAASSLYPFLWFGICCSVLSLLSDYTVSITWWAATTLSSFVLPLVSSSSLTSTSLVSQPSFLPLSLLPECMHLNLQLGKERTEERRKKQGERKCLPSEA